MGFFVNAAGNEAQVGYASAKNKGYIARRDGRIHAFLYNGFGRTATNVSGIDEISTIQIETLLACLYADGYEVVDIKFHTVPNQEKVSGTKDRYLLLILYR